MKEERPDQLDQLLDLLADEVAKRLRAEPEPSDASTEPVAASDKTAKIPQVEETPPRPPQTKDPSAREPDVEATLKPEPDGSHGETRPAPPTAPPVSSHTAQLLGRLALGLLALVIVINIPINRHGTTLATAMPDRRALVVRDGLVVKEEDDPEIYVYENGRFRWISSLRGFEMHGYTWEDVHVVEDGFLEPYKIGPPIHVILKCPDSPHIYMLEGEKKRWIVDIEAFEAEGYVWEDVKFVSCSYLRNLPDGETIPPDHGPPRQP